MSFYSDLICPECQSEIRQEPKWQCPRCQEDFPQFQNIPTLFRSPSLSFPLWKLQWKSLQAELDQEIEKLARELEQESLSALTKKRLKRLREATIAHKKECASLLGFDDNVKVDLSLLKAFSFTLPYTSSFTKYWTNVFRDWAWGDEENQISLELLKSFMPSGMKSMLVFGSGPSRLAYDLHEELKLSKTLCVDINPIFLAIVNRLKHQSLRLTELPAYPSSVENVSQVHELKKIKLSQGSFDFLLADTTQKIFKSKTQEFILAPWYLDILKVEVRQSLRLLNDFLALGGEWVAFGSFQPLNSKSSLSYSREEFVELIEGEGFELIKKEEGVLPYLKSPYSSQYRMEKILIVRAKKIKDSLPPEVYHPVPEWIRNSKLAVPLQEGAWQAIKISHDVPSFLMHLVDSKRSLDDMKKEVSQQFQIPESEALNYLRSFFLQTYEKSTALLF